MKHLCEIWVLLIAVALIGCDRPAPGVETELALSLQSDLMAIDTLMQSQPDSALTLLLDKEMEDPYYQLLLSEALYKNDYAQANRNELLAALAYFDSVQDPFLSARCHYMNGVGYHEMDSMVLACEEYMKAIQIMEEHYPEKTLVGLKAKYLALAYTKLTELFSDQYLHEQAIYFGKQALPYYYRYYAEPWHIAWILTRIGIHYEMLEQWDSANCYFNHALDVLPDSSSSMYRDIATEQAFLLYQTKKDTINTLNKLKWLFNQSESEKEYFSRSAIIGAVYFHERLYDSAWSYLCPVFYESSIVELKKQCAMWLIEICKSQNKTQDLLVFNSFLAPFANQSEISSTLKSQLTGVYDVFRHDKNNYCKNQEKRTTSFFVYVMGIILFVVLLGMTITRFLWKKQHDKKTFLKEPVCQHILNIVNDTAFKAKMDYKLYTDIALNKEQLLALRLAADKHYHGFARKLRSKYPGLTDDDLNHCCLLLLGLEEAAISGLLQKSYTAVCDRNRKLKKELGIREDLFDEIRSI